MRIHDFDSDIDAGLYLDLQIISKGLRLNLWKIIASDLKGAFGA
jgi:hypothetical protein